MREETAKASGRDLLLNGVQLHVLWKLVSGTWSRKSGRNPLYWANRAPRQGRNWSGYNVILRRHSRTLREFERFVRTDESYGPGRLEGVWRLWIEGQERPPFDVHPKICAEVPYNEVTIGERSEQVLRIQQQARLLFNTKAFVEDYTRVVFEVKALRHELRTTYPFPKRGEPKRPQGSAERQLIRKYRSARAFVMEFRAVYEQVKSVGDVPALPVGLVSLRGFLPIRSVFYRVLNRRYQPAHFWPLAVSTKLDGQQAVPDFWSQAVDGTDEAPLLQEQTSTRGRWFAPATGVIGPQRLVGADISSSQTQLLAVLLGLEGLEREASSTETPFKHLLAQRAWEMYQERGDLLRAGYDGVKNYEGPRDDRLIELVKTLWMRRLYGSTVRQVIVDQSWNPDTFGPGWVDTTVQGWSGLSVAHFLSTLNGYAAVEQFLNACRWIGEHADPYEGVTVDDPLDRSKFTWNPVARLNKKLRLGGLDVILSVPKGPEKNGRYPVNRRELVNMIAPCLVHMLDAYFSALVLDELESRGVRELVAVHDCWYLPEAVLTDDGHFSGFGREILAESLNAAAKPWLKGLGPVYDRITFYLRSHPDFGPMLRTARAKWEDRVRRQDWPRFAAKASALFQISRIEGRG
jgi:hypothetical protein